MKKRWHWPSNTAPISLMVDDRTNYGNGDFRLTQVKGMNPSVRGAVLLALVLVSVGLAGQTNTQPFSFADGGGISWTTAGTSPTLQAAYARIGQSLGTPAGFALFGFQQGGRLVSEVAIPAANSIRAGRVYSETGGGVYTGIAIANTSNEAVSIAWYFTNSAGAEVAADVLTIPPDGQIAKFLSEAPFNLDPESKGAFSFFALTSRPDLTLAVVALRGLLNERGEFLLTALPVIPLEEHQLVSSPMIPFFVSGGGWATQVIAVNPTDRELSGEVAFLDQNGGPSFIESASGSGGTFKYRVAARSSWSFETSRNGPLRLGSARLQAAAGAEVPVAFHVLSFAPDGVTVAATAVPPSRSATHSSLFVDEVGHLGDGQPSSIQTGIVIANPDSVASVRVLLDLRNADGASTGLLGTVDIPGGGQVSAYLSRIPGLESLPSPFQGGLRVSASAPVTAIGIRSRYNERQDFIATTLLVVREDDEYFDSVARYSPSVFPHVVDGGGFTTKVVLFSGWTKGPVSGALEFFTQTGLPLPLNLQVR